jgi:tetratricopeptide (TPR) repeat protein
MRKSVLALILIAFVSSAFAQKKKKNEKTEPAKQEVVAPQPEPVKTEPAAKKDSVPAINPMIRHYAIKYQVAVQWNDPEVAKDALYDLIVENQGNDSIIYELAYYYFSNQKYPSAVLVSQELLKRNPKNPAALEMSAVGYENIGVFDRALQSYESLFLLQNNPTVLYKMGFLQLRLKRYKESTTSADILLADKKIDDLKVTYTGSDNKAKEFPMRAAVLNLKGMVLQEQGDKVTAKTLFQQSLAISADFTPAKENLAKLK